MLLPVFTAAQPVFLGASGGGHQSLCGQQEATPRWSHLPGGPWEPRHISTGKELVSEAKLPSGPETHMLWNGNASCPPPQPWRERGAGFPALLREGAALRSAPGGGAQSSSSSFAVTVGTLS